MLFPTISIFLTLPLTLTQAFPLTKRHDAVKIRSRRNDQCLTPSPSSDTDTYTNGTPLTTVNCTFAKLWDISPGSGSVMLSGTQFALDAGSGKEDNEGVKIWHSYPGLFQQTWYRTYDQRIAIFGGDQCLDLGDDGPQTHVLFSPSPSPSPSPCLLFFSFATFYGSGV
ncbi:hypothetical protein L202_07220 [Cryptococcus amylolentus CBS 6039]|uniref:Ricin B lectin domain-containing protein n=1 Tax=Cryptococcus amylolentus CBS 6039 TaxID=1295533 RepID=A0A1E3HBH2_9TREE|nr:hypothetical protein L202_07220 [Cryptococcus amylolentus CBS 6039]ODN73673.1 hypothetical protein L202_07220 [Cryptococcus amylolentus CBS 6039]